MDHPVENSSVQLNFASDWGTGPIFTICGWLAGGLRPLYPPDSTFDVRITPGVLENIYLVGQGKAHLGGTLPPLNVRLARDGKGDFSQAYPHLRAIGKLPHHTLFSFVVSAETGISSIEEIRARRYPLKLATRLASYGSINFIAKQILEYYGLTPSSLQDQGGEIVQAGAAYSAIEQLQRGEADAILNQVGTAIWTKLAQSKRVRFLAFDEKLVQHLEEQYGCTRAWIKKGQFVGVEKDTLCLDWSDLIVFVSEELRFDVAYNLARLMTEARHTLEQLMYTPGQTYSHLTAPIDPKLVCRNLEVPLHAGAEQWYHECGYL
jgi:TRAP transporter TAXI family solute receptor